MKSNRIVAFFQHSLAASLAVCLLAGLAAGAGFHTTAEGHFTLPADANWGGAVLPAGEYSFSLASAELPAVLKIKSGKRTVALVMAASHNTFKPSQDNALILVRHGSQSSIQVLKLGCIGQAYGYAPPKGEKPSLVAQGPQLMQRIPITVAGD